LFGIRSRDGQPENGCRMSPAHAAHAFAGILLRELQRFVQQRGRLIAALTRPLLWLFVFAAGFRAVLGVSIVAPYETYVPYETYIVPGLAGMIQLFNGMQSSLSMVYDREIGSMRVLLTAPLPRWYMLASKLFAGAVISTLQVYAFLAVTPLVGVRFSPAAYLLVLPVLLLTGLMLGAVGLLMSSVIRQLENFAGVMNFVIFPAFFLSSALYPLWKMREASEFLYWLCEINPFNQAVELIRFALYRAWNGEALLGVMAALAVFGVSAIVGYDPRRSLVVRKVV
jgi:ABC-2 type transport system permease protein